MVSLYFFKHEILPRRQVELFEVVQVIQRTGKGLAPVTLEEDIGYGQRDRLIGKVQQHGYLVITRTAGEGETAVVVFLVKPVEGDSGIGRTKGRVSFPKRQQGLEKSM